jgi:hypothetical protein
VLVTAMEDWFIDRVIAVTRDNPDAFPWCDEEAAAPRICIDEVLGQSGDAAPMSEWSLSGELMFLRPPLDLYWLEQRTPPRPPPHTTRTCVLLRRYEKQPSGVNSIHPAFAREVPVLPEQCDSVLTARCWWERMHRPQLVGSVTYLLDARGAAVPHALGREFVIVLPGAIDASDPTSVLREHMKPFVVALTFLNCGSGLV